MDASSLVDVNLHFSYLFSEGLERSISHHSDLKRLKGLVQQLQKVEKLTFRHPGFIDLEQTISSNIVDEAKEFWRSQGKILFTCLQSTLKRVEIIGFATDRIGWEFMDPLVEIFLYNALVLEKMVIHTQADGVYQPWEHFGLEKSRKLLEAMQKILSYKRASPAAEVLFLSYVE